MNRNLLRLSLFQLGMGFSLVVYTGALNRVLIAEEQIPAAAVGWLLSLGLFVAPVRLLLGSRSDSERKTYGYRRLPYIWYGIMLVFAGLSAGPFSLLLLSNSSDLRNEVPFAISLAICTVIFMAYAIGSHVAQTGYLALVTDLTPKHERTKAVAMLWIALIIGQILSSIVVGYALEDFSPFKLVQVMQSTSVVFVVCAIAAIWRQDKAVDLESDDNDGMSSKIFGVLRAPKMKLFFAVVFFGTLGLTAQDVLLEPYGAQVLAMTVTETTRLTALWGAGMLIAILFAWKVLPRLQSPLLGALAACGLGLAGFSMVLMASSSQSLTVFACGAFTIGLANGLFLIATLSLVMSLADLKTAGLYVGMWGLVQTTAAGLGSLTGSAVRDIVTQVSGNLVDGYSAVYAGEMAMLCLAVVVLLMIPRHAFRDRLVGGDAFSGLSDIPGT
jgi:BCD family chlorophyll transporter-like MFS transporter